MAAQLTPVQQRQLYIQEFMGLEIFPGEVPTIQQLQTYWNNNLLRAQDLRFEIDVRNNSNYTALLWYASNSFYVCIPHLIFLLSNGANREATRFTNQAVEQNVLELACNAENRLHIIFFLHLGITIQTQNQYNRIIELLNNLTDANITSYIQQVTILIQNIVQIQGNANFFIRNLIQQRIALYEQQNGLPQTFIQLNNDGHPFNNNQLNKKYLKYKAKYLQLKNQLN